MKRKILKKCLCISLILSLLLTSGCSSDGKSKSAMGRYIEENMTLPENISEALSFTYEKEDGFHLYGYPKDRDASTLPTLYISQDGKTWNKKESPWLDSLSRLQQGNESLFLQEIVHQKDGSIYTLYSDEKKQNHIAKTTDGLTVSEIVIPEWNKAAIEDGNLSLNGTSKDGNLSLNGTSVSVENSVNNRSMANKKQHPSSMNIMDNGDLLISYSNAGASRYDGTTGALLKDYPGNGFRLTSSPTKLVQAKKDYTGFFVYDIETGAVSQEITYESRSFFNSDMVMDDSNTLYLGDSMGISSIVEGGSIWERIVDGSMASMSMPTRTYHTMTPDGTDGFYILYRINEGDGGLELIHYTYSADTPTVPDQELVIYGLEDNSTIRQAIGEFQRANPQVKVNFRVTMGEDSTATTADIIRSLNTELIAGKGPDILLLDGLPIDSYLEKGVLEDLSDFLTPQIETGDLLKNIITAYEKEGKIFAVPARFTMPIMMGEKSILNTMTSLEAIAKEAAKESKIPFLPSFTNEETLFETFYTPFIHTWLSESNTIQEEALTAYLKQIKTIYDGQKALDDTMTSTMMISAVSSSNATSEEIPMGPSQIMYGQNRFSLDTLSGVFGTRYVYSALNKQKEYDVSPALGQENPMFYPKVVVGINSASKQKELAKQFIDLLFSPSIQNLQFGDGIAVNLDSFKKGLDGVNRTLSKTIDMSPVLTMIQSLSTPITVDNVIQDAVREAFTPLLAGEKTPEEAAKMIIEKVQLYLAE